MKLIWTIRYYKLLLDRKLFFYLFLLLCKATAKELSKECSAKEESAE